mgnify:CR=1 FL=1
MKRISFLLALLLLISAGCGKAGNKSESITLEVAGKMTSEEYYKIGFTKDSLKDFTGSIAAFTKAIELEPQNSNDYLYRALSKGILEDQIGEFADLSMMLRYCFCVWFKLEILNKSVNPIIAFKGVRIS